MRSGDRDDRKNNQIGTKPAFPDQSAPSVVEPAPRAQAPPPGPYGFADAGVLRAEAVITLLHIVSTIPAGEW